MTKRIIANERGMVEHYKVRVALQGSIIHLASRTQPKLLHDTGRLVDVAADWIDNPEYGDTVGFIHWPSVVAITWRWSA